jgi:hypothetical protein
MSFKMILTSAAALAMAAGTPALAAKSQSPSQQVVASDAGGGGGEKARKICRTFRNTISRMKAEKVCLTRADWKKFEAEQQQ